MGCRIAVLSRSRPKLDQLLEQLPGSGHIAMSVDLRDHVRVLELVTELLDQVGPVHILINNMAGPKGGPLIDALPAEFIDGISDHILLAHHLVQALLPGMKSSGYGRIINIISTSVKIPIPGLGVSNTVRGAMANWSKTLSLELAAFGITVNNVLPGFTETDRLDAIVTSRAQKGDVAELSVRQKMMASVPMQRFASAQEVSAAIAFLASPAASYITGVNIPVDGGRTGSL